MKDIWGFYDYKRGGALGSTIVHILAVVAIILATILGKRIVDVAKPKPVVQLIAPDEIPVMEPSKKVSGGGGGGGDRDKLQASQGRLPKQAMEQITPPLAVVRNPNPKLAMPPTVVVPPQVHLQQPNMPDLGDPLSRLPTVASNGTGSGGGIGSGSGGGVGMGSGPGVGAGHGGGTGGGAFRVGGGVLLLSRFIRPILSILRKPEKLSTWA